MSIEQRISAIQTERGRVWSEAQGFLEALKGTEMSGEERAQWERYNERLDQLEADGKDLAERFELERDRGRVREAQSIVFGEPDEHRELQTAAADLRAWIRGEKRMDALDPDGGRVNGLYANVEAVRRERELIRMGASPEEVRVMAWDTGSVASAVPTLFDRYLYEVMEESVAAFRMPMRRITTDSGAPMDFPKVTTHATGTQVAAQGSALTDTTPVFGKLTLTPVKFGALITMASEVISDSGVDVVEFVARDIGRAVGRKVNEAVMAKINAAVFVGSAGTVSTGGTLNSTFGYNSMVDLEFSIADEYRNSSSVAFLIRDKTAGALRKLRDGAGGTEGAPLWQPSLTGGVSGIRTPAQFAGYPVFTDPSIASMASNAKIAYFGDWSSWYFRTLSGGVLVERNDSVGFTTDQVYFRGLMRADSGAADLTALNILKQSV